MTINPNDWTENDVTWALEGLVVEGFVERKEQEDGTPGYRLTNSGQNKALGIWVACLLAERDSGVAMVDTGQ